MYYRGRSRTGFSARMDGGSLRAFDGEIDRSVAPLLVAQGLLLMFPVLSAGNRLACETRRQTFAMIQHLKGFRLEELREHGGDAPPPAEC